MYVKFQSSYHSQVILCFVQGKVRRGEKMPGEEDRPRVRCQVHPRSSTAGQGGCAAGSGGHEEAAAQALTAALRRILSQE